MANILPASDAECVDYAVRLLRAGEVVCIPTDTVYGLAVDASNDQSVRRLYAVKGRSPDKALPLFVANAFEASGIADMPPIAQRLVDRFWPGALTIVFNKLPDFRSAALAKQQTVAVRVPDHDLIIDIIRTLGGPITGTSANRAGSRPPISAAEAALQLGDMVALVIDGGRSPGGVESTVVDLSVGSPRILREGAISKREIEEALGRPVAKE